LNRETIKTIIGFLIIGFVWGSTWLAIKIGLESFPPVFSAGVRFLIASIIIFIIIKVRQLTIQNDKASKWLYLIMGLFSFVIPFGLVYWAELFVPSGLASILFAVYPFGVTLITYFSLPSEKIGMFKIIGMIMGFAGIVIIFSQSLSLNFATVNIGMFAIVLSALMQSGIAVTIKKYGSHLNPLTMNFFPLLIAGITMIIYGLIIEDMSIIKFTVSGISSILYLAIFGTILTFTTYYWLLKRINIVLLSLNAFINPVIAVFLGWLFANEVLTFRQSIGSTVVLLGILIANYPGLNKYILSNRERNND